jgi:hypothetical protein
VSRLKFDGLYVDVNAVSPATTRQIGQLFTHFVDGGIVGPPPSSSRSQLSQSEQGNALTASRNPSGATRLYLSGEEASAVAALFTGSPIEARVIGSQTGQASALKMAYAAWTKGTSALILSVAALATSEEVIDELLDEWDMSIPQLRERLERVSSNIGKKAWRFVGEMEEIADTYRAAGLPDGFHLAAAEIYSRLANLKEDPRSQAAEKISNMLLNIDRDQPIDS